MDLVLQKADAWNKAYNHFLTLADPRVEDWFLMQYYTPTLVLTGLYLLLVWVIPKVMDNREPFQFRWTLFFYNSFLVALNFHIFYELITCTYRRGYNYGCQPVDYSDNPDEVRIAKALWWYYFSKLIEFLDTIFFALRKKNNQVSFLHVYHHATMFPIWWIGIKWVPGGNSFFGAMINSFIHVLMYTYYGVASLGPEFQKFLWWKRYLTILQLIQFVIGMCHAFTGLYIGCNFPDWMGYALIAYGLSILSLFLNFYFHAYLKPRKPRTKSQKETNGHVPNGVIKNGKTESKKKK